MLRNPLKSKTFQASATDNLDTAMNAWFADNPEIELVQLQSYCRNDNTMIFHPFIAQIIYREPLGSGILKDGNDA